MNNDFTNRFYDLIRRYKAKLYIRVVIALALLTILACFISIVFPRGISSGLATSIFFLISMFIVSHIRNPLPSERRNILNLVDSADNSKLDIVIEAIKIFHYTSLSDALKKRFVKIVRQLHLSNNLYLSVHDNNIRFLTNYTARMAKGRFLTESDNDFSKCASELVDMLNGKVRIKDT